jgi:hypothetical protein
MNHFYMGGSTWGAATGGPGLNPNDPYAQSQLRAQGMGPAETLLSTQGAPGLSQRGPSVTAAPAGLQGRALPQDYHIPGNMAQNMPMYVQQQVQQEDDKIYALVMALTNPAEREVALLELSKKRESFEDLAPVLWYSFGASSLLLSWRCHWWRPLGARVSSSWFEKRLLTRFCLSNARTTTFSTSRLHN